LDKNVGDAKRTAVFGFNSKGASLRSLLYAHRIQQAVLEIENRISGRGSNDCD